MEIKGKISSNIPVRARVIDVGAVSSLANLIDVDTSGASDGAFLVYDQDTDTFYLSASGGILNLITDAGSQSINLIDENISILGSNGINTSLSSGILTIAIDNNLTIANDLNVTNDVTIGSDLTIANDLNVTNDVTIGSDLNVTNDVTIGSDLNVTNDVTIGGDLTITGEINASISELNINDSLIHLAKNNTVNDLIDIGFVGTYGSTPKYTGFFRDASDGKYKFFSELNVLPNTTVDIAGLGYTTSTIVANLEGTFDGNSSSYYTDASNLDAGIIPDARISESSIIQHESALTITESQISDLSHLDSDAIHFSITGEINSISEKLTPASSDWLIIEDSESGLTKKKIQIGNLPLISTASYEETFIAAAGQTVFTLTNKPTFAWVWLNGAAQDPTTWNILNTNLILETPSSENDDIRVYYITVGSITTNYDSNAIHIDISGEIDSVDEKVTPADGDWLIIEDSESGLTKKKIQIGNLPFEISTGSYEETFIAASGQTVFTLTNTPTFAWVWLNGAAQDPTTWNISNSNLILETPSSENDDIRVYYITVGSITANYDSNAIHIGISGEINSISEKLTPVSSDWLIIEDSESGLTKKKIQIGNLTTIDPTYRNLWVGAGAMIPRKTDGATPETIELATNDIQYDGLSFNSVTSQGLGFWVNFGDQWNAGTFKAKFYWTATTGSGTVKFDIGGRSYADDDALDQAIGTKQNSTDTLITANDLHISPATGAITVTGATAGEPIYLEITRDTANDTLSADATLLGVMLQILESSTTITVW